MAATKTLVFTGISINGVSYSQHLNEGVEVSIEPLTDLVRDGQTLVSAYDVSFAVNVYDDGPLTDTNVYTNTSQTPVLANVVFTGATGGQTLTVSNVIVNGNKVYDQNRTAVNLFGTKRTTTLALAIAES